MHPTALSNGKLFFDTYVARLGAVNVVDVGSQDVNGSLREVCPSGITYTGVDFERGKGVDVVITDPYSLPFETGSVDVVVSSSCFEHSEMFWLVFSEIMRVLKPGGLLYLNVPSNGGVHRYPVDCWRFYPDSGAALVSWALRNGQSAALLESYISEQRDDVWNDFVAVFVRDAQRASDHPARICDAFEHFRNGRRIGVPSVLRSEDHPQDLRIVQSLRQKRDELHRQVDLLVKDRDALRSRLEAIERSTLWRMEGLERAVHRIEHERDGITQQRDALQERLDAIEGSGAWRAVNALQGPASWLRGLNHRRLERRHQRRRRRAASASVEADGAGVGSAPLQTQTTSAQVFAEVDPRSIVLRTDTRAPEVSIVIPTYGKAAHTLRCLASIVANNPRARYEVIVIEDGSPDPAARLVGEVADLRFVCNEFNLGYLRSTNKAAVMARGEFLLLLNNDTELLPGALDAMVDLARRRSDAGAVGAKLVFPDGRLQEAGGLVWRDGNVWNYGRFDHPGRSMYNYVRPVDYCSAAALLVRRDVWERLGGFDEHYLPAYCEDLDLAYRIRAAGYQVLYQPRAVVVHDEGVSHGTSTHSGTKAHQVTNLQKFKERWAQELERDGFDHPRPLLRVRDRAKGLTTVMVIDHAVPEPDRDAGSRSTFQILQNMLRLGYVVKFWPTGGRREQRYIQALQDLGIEFMWSEGMPRFDDWLTDEGQDIDCFFVNRPQVADEVLGPIRTRTQAPVVFYGHDVHHERMRMQQSYADDPALVTSTGAMEVLEHAVWDRCDVVFYPSVDEVRLVRRLKPEVDCRLLNAYCFDDVLRRGMPVAGRHILFVSGFAHPPNVDAAVWFVNAVMPLVAAKHPDVVLELVGSYPTEQVKALAGAQVIVTGAVSEAQLEAHYLRARVAVVPLRFGGGVKLKVVEAMGRGVPLVTTPVGVQGLEGLPDGIRVHDDPQAFAASVSQLLDDDGAWLALSAAQVEYVRRSFSSSAMREQLAAAIGAGARAAADAQPAASSQSGMRDPEKRQPQHGAREGVS